MPEGRVGGMCDRESGERRVFPFGGWDYAIRTNFARLGVYREGVYSFPKDLIRGPVRVAAGHR